MMKQSLVSLDRWKANAGEEYILNTCDMAKWHIDDQMESLHDIVST